MAGRTMGIDDERIREIARWLIGTAMSELLDEGALFEALDRYFEAVVEGCVPRAVTSSSF